jgi:23S rRNA pseudouridine1911/1915/1917 synthase
LDSVLSRLSGWSRAQVQRAVAEGRVKVGGRVAQKASTALRGGEELSLQMRCDLPQELTAEAIPLDILYEDREILAVNKPAGMVVHPAPGHPQGTLVHATLGYLDAGWPAGGGVRPGIVHRLDRDTSGVILVAKSVQAHRHLTGAFQRREVRKTYLALTAGRLPFERGEVDLPIGRHPVKRQQMAVLGLGGRQARTSFEVLATCASVGGDWISLVIARPVTGRTHQIRVHLRHLGAPVLGDPVYGRASPWISRQALHAWKIAFPWAGNPQLQLSAPPPNDLQAAWLEAGGAAELFPA